MRPRVLTVFWLVLATGIAPYSAPTARPLDYSPHPAALLQDTGATSRVSVHSDGTQGNNGSYQPFVSADGRYVVFYSTASNLVDIDTNSHADVFVHDRQTGQTTLASVRSDGTQGNGDSGDPSICAEGRYVAFSSPLAVGQPAHLTASRGQSPRVV